MDAQDIPAAPGVYCIRNTITNLVYIGSAKDLRKRKSSHFSMLLKGNHRNPKLQNAFNKYGSDTFVFEILEIILIPELLTTREQWWFSKLRPFGKRGFNLSPTAGSTLGIKASSKTKEKQRLAHTGKKQTEEWIRKRTAGQKGRRHSPEAKARVSAANKGRQRTPEENMLKMKSLIITDPNGKEYAILGIKRFCDAHGLSRDSLIKVAKGIYSQHKGYRARYPGTEPQDPKPPRKKKEKKHSPNGYGKGQKRPYERYEYMRKTLLLTDPNGIEYLVHGINDFCKAHGLDSSCITKVAKGIYSQHRGWTARYPSPDEL